MRPAFADHELTHAALAVERRRRASAARSAGSCGRFRPAPIRRRTGRAGPRTGCRVGQCAVRRRRRSSAGGASRRRGSCPAFAARSCWSHVYCSEPGPQPPISVAVAVQHDDVPGAEVVAVPALARGGRGRAEVVEIAGSAGGAVLVVAHGRLDARLVAAPARVEAAARTRPGSRGSARCRRGWRSCREGCRGGARRTRRRSTSRRPRRRRRAASGRPSRPAWPAPRPAIRR